MEGRVAPTSLTISAISTAPTSSLTAATLGPSSPIQAPWGGCGLRTGTRWADASPTCASPTWSSWGSTPKATPSTVTVVPEGRPSIISSSSPVGAVSSTPVATARIRVGQTLVRRPSDCSPKSTTPAIIQGDRRLSVDSATQVLRPQAEISRVVPVRRTNARWADTLDLDETPMNAISSSPSQPKLSRQSSLQSKEAEAVGRPAVRPALKQRWADFDFSPDGTTRSQVDTGTVSESLSAYSQDRTGRAFSFHIASGTPSPSPSHNSSPPRSPPEEQEDPDEDDDWMTDLPPERTQSAVWMNYPTSPCVLHSRTQASGSEPRIGIDIGGVLTREGDPTYDRKQEWDLEWEVPGAFNTVWQIVQVFGPENVFIVSKVKLDSPMHRQIEHWLHEVCKFCEITGMLKENLHFVSSMNGPNGKGAAAAKLGLSHFIDDKIECLESVWNDPFGNSGSIVERWDGTLFHFAKGGCGSGPPSCDIDSLHPRMQQYYCGVANWADLQEQLRLRLPDFLKKSGEEILVPGNVMTIDPALERGVVVPLFAQERMRAKDERPPWFVSSPTADRATSANPLAALQWNSDEGRPKLKLKPRSPDRTVVAASSGPAPATSPTANRSQSERPVAAALQRGEGGRPKLMLKPRTGAPVSLASQISQEGTTNGNPIAASSPKSAKVIGITVEMSPKHSTGRRPSVESAVVTQPAPTPGPALRQDPSGGRPKLVLKRPSVEAAVPAVVTQPAPAPGPALQQDPSGGRPKLVLKRPSVEAAVPAVVTQPAPAPGPALQQDPSGGRPKLVLKPRSQPVDTSAFCKDVNEKLRG